MTFLEGIFCFRRTPILYDFFEVFEICRHFVPPFALVSSRLDWSRDVGSGTLIVLKPRDLVVSFSIVPCKMRDVLQHVASTQLYQRILRRIFRCIYQIPLSGEECPITRKRRKRSINFVLEECNTWVPGKTFYFKIPKQQYKSCLNLDANFYCYFPLFIYTNAGHILEFICTCFFSLFSWLSWFRG